MKVKAVRKVRARKTNKIGLILVVIALAITALATIGVPRNTSQASQKKYKATKEIVRDETTGTLRKPTDAETEAMVAQISALTNRSAEGLTVKSGPNGAQTVDLDGRFGGVVLGVANADGSTDVRCVFSMEEAEAFLGLEEVQ